MLRTEESLRAEVGERAELRGRADRLEHTDEGWRVVDLKTGATVPSAAETAVHPQLAAYQVALRAAGEEVDGARLVYLSSGASKPTVRDQPGLTDGDGSDGAHTGQPGAGVPGDGPAPGSVAWAVDLVDQAASVMGGAAFVARQNPTCRTCPVRGACPVQGAAPEGGAP